MLTVCDPSTYAQDDVQSAVCNSDGQVAFSADETSYKSLQPYSISDFTIFWFIALYDNPYVTYVATWPSFTNFDIRYLKCYIIMWYMHNGEALQNLLTSPTYIRT